MTIRPPSLTVSQYDTIQSLFAPDEENRELVPIAQLLASGAIEEITTLNAYLTECGDDGTPEPGEQWNGYVVVLYGGHYMHVIDPCGGVNSWWSH